MHLLNKLFALSKKKGEHEKLAPFLNGIVGPLQQTAVEQINLALRHMPSPDAQGRFMLSLMHVCLAAILRKLSTSNRSPRDFSHRFKVYALSRWDRPSGMSIDSVHKMFTYTQQEIGSRLENPNEDEIIDIGLTLLSIAVQTQERFTTVAEMACGKSAHACWTQADRQTDKLLGTPRAIDAATAKIDEQVYLFITMITMQTS